MSERPTRIGYKILSVCALIVGSGAFTAGSAATLDDVKQRGRLICGVETGLAGFAMRADGDRWIGFDVDFCRAVAAAIFADGDAVEFKPLTAAERFGALQSGAIDLLARNTTWTFTRDVDFGFEFVGVMFYDGQGFLVPKALGVTQALELNGARICIETGTTSELNLADYYRRHKMMFESVVVSTSDEARRTYLANACDTYTSDRSALAATRSMLPDPSAHILLPDYISKEPLSPLVRHDDNQWADLVRWVRNVLILAEELDVSSENAMELRATSVDPDVRRLLGAEGELGVKLGLTADWAFDVIMSGGNYREIFDRNLGPDTPLALDRGLNALWSDGGILYAPPLR